VLGLLLFAGYTLDTRGALYYRGNYNLARYCTG